MGKFYRNLANNVNNAVTSNSYGKTANNANIYSNYVQKHLLATSDFAKGMLDDINHYVMRDRLNNASFRQWLDLISKNIIRHQIITSYFSKTFPLLMRKIRLFDLCCKSQILKRRV